MAQLQEVRPEVYADASNKVDARPNDPFSHLQARWPAAPPHRADVHLLTADLTLSTPLSSVLPLGSPLLTAPSKRTLPLLYGQTFVTGRNAKALQIVFFKVYASCTEAEGLACYQKLY